MKKRSLLAGSTITAVSQMWGFLLTLFVMPYVVHLLGPDRHGLLSLVLVLANYLTILDFGFGWGIIRFVAQCAAKNDFERMEGIIRVSSWLTAVTGILLGVSLILLAPWLVNSVFNIPPDKITTMRTGVILGASLPVLFLFSNLLGGVLKGLQRFDLAVGLRLLLTTSQMVGYVLLLKAGYGLISLWLLLVIVNLCCTLAYWLSIKRLIPNVSLTPKFDKSYFKTIFSFSFFGMLTKFLTMPYFYLDKLFICSLLPVSYLSYYVIPFNLSQKIGAVGCNMVSVLFPFASKKAGNRDEFISLYRRTIPVAYSLIVPIVLVVITLGPRFIGYWIGEEYGRHGQLPLIVISIGFGFAVLGSADGTFLEAAGKPKIRTIIYAVLAAIMLPLCFLLTKVFGIKGTALAVCFGFSLGGALEVLFCQILLMKNWWYVTHILGRCTVLIIVGLLVGWLSQFVVYGLWSTVGVGVLAYLILICAATYIFRTSQHIKGYIARILRWVLRALKTVRVLVIPASLQEKAQ